jgi:hypothetical protein
MAHPRKMALGIDADANWKEPEKARRLEDQTGLFTAG